MASRILVVDDESALLLTLVANLELAGFEVVEAADGERALELVRAEDFDLVLSDIRMPGMSGVELYQRIRAHDPELPVVLMTAFALEGLVEQAIAEGAFAVLPKPFDVDHLIAALAAALRRPVVLVVDDDEPVATTTAEALCAAGIRARAVFGGAEAVSAARDGSTDVCVVDMVMPGLDGATVVEQIRTLDPAIACIAVSGHDVPALLHRAAPHVFRFLRKPIAPADLVHTVAQARARRR